MRGPSRESVELMIGLAQTRSVVVSECGTLVCSEHNVRKIPRRDIVKLALEREKKYIIVRERQITASIPARTTALNMDKTAYVFLKRYNVSDTDTLYNFFSEHTVGFIGAYTLPNLTVSKLSDFRTKDRKYTGKGRRLSSSDANSIRRLYVENGGDITPAEIRDYIGIGSGDISVTGIYGIIRGTQYNSGVYIDEELLRECSDLYATTPKLCGARKIPPDVVNKLRRIFVRNRGITDIGSMFDRYIAEQYGGTPAIIYSLLKGSTYRSGEGIDLSLVDKSQFFYETYLTM